MNTADPTQGAPAGETPHGPARLLTVVFAVHDPDGHYWLNTAVALTSLAHHARSPIDVHIIHDRSLSETAKRRLAEIARTLQVPLTLVEQEVPPIIQQGILGKFSPASAFRLLIPNLFPDEELVVYLDSDLVLNGVDINELASQVPAEAPLAAVPDVTLVRASTNANYLRDIGLDPSRYFNSGVLALRPKLLPKTLLEEFVAFVQGHKVLMHPDQDFLNQRFGAEVHLLDEKFNTTIGLVERRALRPLGFYSGRIVHYIGAMKPMVGAVSTAFLPFIAHSFLTPEILSGQDYDPKIYLFPVEGFPHQLKGKAVDKDPNAETFYEQLDTIASRLSVQLKALLSKLEPLDVSPEFKAVMTLRRHLGGREVILAVVDMYGRVWTHQAQAAATSVGRPDLAEGYYRALAALVPEGRVETGAQGARLTSRGQPPRLLDLLSRSDDWAAAVADYLRALSEATSRG